jgi:hypothetical protein
MGYCSFAATGANEFFQAIYVCRTCNPSTNEELCLCICQACADACHAECAVDFIGMGRAYCDCDRLGSACHLRKESVQVAAARFGIIEDSVNGEAAAAAIAASPLACLVDNFKDAPSGYLQDAFVLPPLQDDDVVSTELIEQAQELVRHSKETFWLDANSSNHQIEDLCSLEQLAWNIFRRHSEVYLTNTSETCKLMGAEWWVQVKCITYNDEHNSLATGDSAQNKQPYYNNGKEAIDLHYDKDEDLAETFGLGVFPTLSTVTYLTDSIGAPPTLVLSRRYDETNSANPIHHVLVSHPRRGKHLVFDGRLLHGAPFHLVFREQARSISSTDINVRVTFLVNLWIGHKPAGVRPLERCIHNLLKERVRDSIVSSKLSSSFDFERQSISMKALNTETDCKVNTRVELPFLGKGTTWGDNDTEEDSDDDQHQIVLSTFVPPVTNESTELFHFGPGLEAFLSVPSIDEEEADQEEA